MRWKEDFLVLTALGALIAIEASCRKDYFPVPPPPDLPRPTSSLEAQYQSAPPASLLSPYWNSADYLKVGIDNVSSGLVYEDGKLNMTGTYAGKSSFNKGNDPGLTLKAAYTNDRIYILAEWTDSDMDLASGSFLWKGPGDPLKTDSTGGWTRQRNSDKFSLAFEISSASSSNGSFGTVGCAAVCHDNAGVPEMHPSSGTADLWNWDAALSSPLGYMLDMVATQDSLEYDSGQAMHARNTAAAGNRSAPQYEWDGTTQTVTLPDGKTSLLDPGFFLLNKTAFPGDAARGDSIYHIETTGQPGHCYSCHGNRGEGGSASTINNISMNKKSTAALKQNMDIVPDMASYWLPLNSQARNDIIAYMRSLAGVPGNYLQAPDGSNADITVTSNITPVQVTNAMLTVTNVHTKYRLLIVRKLQTGNPDDIQFDLGAARSYKFGIALMDNDGRNHVGSVIETLIFK